jgi:hypothetical protein
MAHERIHGRMHVRMRSAWAHVPAGPWAHGIVMCVCAHFPEEKRSEEKSRAGPSREEKVRGDTCMRARAQERELCERARVNARVSV